MYISWKKSFRLRFPPKKTIQWCNSGLVASISNVSRGCRLKPNITGEHHIVDSPMLPVALGHGQISFRTRECEEVWYSYHVRDGVQKPAAIARVRPRLEKYPPQGGAPPVINWFINLLSIDISAINHSEIGVMFTNWTLSCGHHLAYPSMLQLVGEHAQLKIEATNYPSSRLTEARHWQADFLPLVDHLHDTSDTITLKPTRWCPPQLC